MTQSLLHLSDLQRTCHVGDYRRPEGLFAGRVRELDRDKGVAVDQHLLVHNLAFWCPARKGDEIALADLKAGLFAGTLH
ncbi:hypothetical protein OH764_22655 [Burkholderia sp. M6-3]